VFCIGALTTLLLLTITVLPFAPSDHWSVRVWEFPRVQIASLLAVNIAFICVLYVFGHEYWLWYVVLLIINSACLVFQLYWIAPYTPFFRPEVEKVSVDSQQTLVILTSNVLMHNQQPEKLLAHVERVKPDVLVTLETNQWWQDQLSTLHIDYPHRVPVPLDNLYGMHVYSKLQLEDVQVRELIEKGVPSVTCKLIDSKGHAIHAFFLHPAPPSPSENEQAKERDCELRLVACEVQSLTGPVIVTGDLNDVAWSPTTRDFRQLTGLKDPRIGRGMFNTFHADYSLVRWPLDHIFHSEHFKLVEIKRLDHIGSDHFPLLSILTY
jgi:endonuclease/exonuclease/phosphatase (EEP) superfamily protein YafD